MLNGKLIAFPNRLGIHHCIFVRLRSYESLRTGAYVIAIHLDPRSCFRRETESKFTVFLYNNFLEIFIFMDIYSKLFTYISKNVFLLTILYLLNGLKNKHVFVFF